MYIEKVFRKMMVFMVATTVSTSNKTIGYAVTEKAGAVAGTVNIKLGV